MTAIARGREDDRAVALPPPGTTAFEDVEANRAAFGRTSLHPRLQATRSPTSVSTRARSPKIALALPSA
eukprot:6965143-Pyramimonas_sp.AAC.1